MLFVFLTILVERTGKDWIRTVGDRFVSITNLAVISNNLQNALGNCILLKSNVVTRAN